MPGAVGFEFNANQLLMLSRKISAKMATDFKGATKTVHAEAALLIQQGMVETLKDRVHETGRVQRGSKYLERALLNERNASVTQRGFTVLRDSYMNRSPAAVYWRRIEEGDNTTFDGYILFTNDFNRFSAPFSTGGRRARDGKSMEGPQYRQMRMPQHKGVYVQGIGPFPAYHYTDGGAAALRSFPFKQRYKKALNDVGLKLDHFVR